MQALPLAVTVNERHCAGQTVAGPVQGDHQCGFVLKREGGKVIGSSCMGLVVLHKTDLIQRKTKRLKIRCQFFVVKPVFFSMGDNKVNNFAGITGIELDK